MIHVSTAGHFYSPADPPADGHTGERPDPEASSRFRPDSYRERDRDKVSLVMKKQIHFIPY